MEKKKMIAMLIALVTIVALLGMVKIVPFYVTLVGLVAFLLGGVCGFLFPKKEKEVMVGSPAELKKVKRAKKVATK